MSEEKKDVVMTNEQKELLEKLKKDKETIKKILEENGKEYQPLPEFRKSK